MTKLTEAQRRVLRHALGLDEAAEPYRNRYFAAKGIEHACDDLARDGLMKNIDDGCPYSRFFVVTNKGREAIGAPKDKDPEYNVD